jgi:hypothetical protein
MIQVYSCQQKKRPENNVTESSPVQDFIAELIKHVGGLVPRPIPKQREKQLPTDFVLRCSTRLAMNRAGASAAVTRHIQQNLMLRLGLAAEPEALGPQALEEYSRLFNKPLSQSHVVALAALFGWRVPTPEQAATEKDVMVGVSLLEA